MRVRSYASPCFHVAPSMGLYLAMVADIPQYTMWSSELPDLTGMGMENPRRVENSAIFVDGGILIAQVMSFF